MGIAWKVVLFTAKFCGRENVHVLFPSLVSSFSIFPFGYVSFLEKLKGKNEEKKIVKDLEEKNL